MHILLPPSEGKSAPVSGPTLDLVSLSYPELTGPREAIARELSAVSARPDSLAILKAGERTLPEVEAQRHLGDLPCAPAYQVYTGVLYEAARLGSDDAVTIFSGLFGATAGTDMIPSYRCSMNVSLPKAGPLKTFWRGQLKDHPVLEAASSGATVDMRSGAYQIWNPPGVWWDVRVRDHTGKVITHMAKHYRGLLTRALLDAKSDEVADVARTLGDVSVEVKGNRHHLTLVPAV
ncbi:YaaA family protein [Ancrocorticia populi]|uniref:YaaA family protein n=1 Tax=Ancrocorticia populi TaxID=2175228 RepID=UPI001403EB50|nr:peroxide stress protein YaaA [Ancrocorticia populi]